MPRRKKYTHDQLIERTARVAAEQGSGEDSCPYIYDLRARKIWLKAYKEWHKNERKINGSQNGAAAVAEKSPAGKKRPTVRGMANVGDWQDAETCRVDAD